MATLQVKGVPSSLHRRLQALARRQGRTLRDLVLEAVRREVDRDEFAIRLRTRRPVETGQSAAASLKAARDERDADLLP